LKGKVLIIEDEEEIGELIQLFLSNEGLDSFLAVSAEQALNYLDRESFDLVVLDLNLPGMDGFEFLLDFRKHYTIPVIIVSARSSDEDVIAGLGLGADEFVTKPFKPKLLTARIRALIRRSSKYSQQQRLIFRFGDYELDYDGYLLKKKGEIVNLSTREIEVLRFLIENSGKVLSPDDIFTSVWQQEYGDISAIAVYIQRLRKKIEEDYRNPQYLKTIHGKGYIFIKDFIK